jgi:hypothetical protein
MHSGVPKLEQDALLGVHHACLGLRYAKSRVIKTLYGLHEAAVTQAL